MQVTAQLWTYNGYNSLQRLYVVNVHMSDDPSKRKFQKPFRNRYKIWQFLAEQCGANAVYLVKIDNMNRIYPDKKINKYRNFMNVWPNQKNKDIHVLYFNCLAEDNTVTTYKVTSYAID